MAAAAAAEVRPRFATGALWARGESASGSTAAPRLKENLSFVDEPEEPSELSKRPRQIARIIREKKLTYWAAGASRVEVRPSL